MFIVPCLLKALVVSSGTHTMILIEKTVYTSLLSISRSGLRSRQNQEWKSVTNKGKRRRDRRENEHNKMHGILELLPNNIDRRHGIPGTDCLVFFLVVYTHLFVGRGMPLVPTGDSNCSNGIEAPKQQLQKCPIRRQECYGDLWLLVPSLLLRGCLCEESIHEDVYETKGLLLDNSWYVQRD